MADDLYALPLEAFISARDAAAKALRRSGDRDGAAVLARLPKPTPAAWAANQLARTEPKLLARFLEAGEALRAAQEAALQGGASDLREATRAQRAAVDALMAAAAPLAPGGRPLSRAMADRLRTTLLAAAGNEELAHALADGRLALEAEAGGAWPPPDAGDRAAAPRREPAKARAKKQGDDRRIVSDTNKRVRRRAAKATAVDGREREAREREAAAEREARAKAKREREALERELRDARGALKVLQRAFTAAEKDAHRATARLDAALAEAEAARADAEAMNKLLEEARDVLATTRDEIARLEERT